MIIIFRKKEQHSNNFQIVDKHKPTSGNMHNTKIVLGHNSKSRNKNKQRKKKNREKRHIIQRYHSMCAK